MRQADGAGEAETDADQPAEAADNQRLDVELQHVVETPRAGRHTDADLAGAFAAADQHDVHHPDTAAHQRYRRTTAQPPGERLLGTLPGLHQRRQTGLASSWGRGGPACEYLGGAVTI